MHAEQVALLETFSKWAFADAKRVIRNREYSEQAAAEGDEDSAMYWKQSAKRWEDNIADKANRIISIRTLPSGQYWAQDGTLMNANGTRSIFDDVDK